MYVAEKMERLQGIDGVKLYNRSDNLAIIIPNNDGFVLLDSGRVM